jgi:uncharacterized membrane protein YvbJ
MKDGIRFCSECGTPISSTIEKKVPQQEATSHPQTNAQPVQPKKNWSKKQKIMALSAIVTIFLLAIGYQAGAALTDKDRMITTFGEAVLDNDSELVQSMLHTEDSRLEISEERVENLLSYINNNPSYYSYMMETLQDQSQAFDSDTELTNSSYNGIFYLKNTGKTAFIFDHYTINVVPFYIELTTNYEDAIIYLNAEEIAVSDSENFYLEYGPVMPGTYELKSNYSNEYTMLGNLLEVELFNPHERITYADLSLSGDYVTIYAEYADLALETTLYINGTEVDFSINEQNQFGPVSTDGELSIYAVHEFPWGEIQTEETNISGHTLNLTVESPFTDDLKEDISNSIFNYAHDWADSYSTLDESKFSNVTDNYMEYVNNDFSLMRENNRIWVGEFVKALFDLNSFQLTTDNDGNYLATVNSSLYFDSATVSQDSEGVETETSENNWKYQLIYDEDQGEWIIDDYSRLNFVNHDHAKELVSKTN